MPARAWSRAAGTSPSRRGRSSSGQARVGDGIREPPLHPTHPNPLVQVQPCPSSLGSNQCTALHCTALRVRVVPPGRVRYLLTFFTVPETQLQQPAPMRWAGCLSLSLIPSFHLHIILLISSHFVWDRPSANPLHPTALPIACC